MERQQLRPAIQLVSSEELSEQLEAAAAGERMEWTTLYTSFADVAEQKGLKKAAQAFNQIAEVEKWQSAAIIN